jgi:hypothetical protein
MADILGVQLIEKDASNTASALAVPKGAIAVYAAKGRTDTAILATTQNAIKRNLGNPLSSQNLGSGVTDMNRGLQNAFAMVGAGKPTYIMRAIPTTVAPVKASVALSTDATTTRHVLATALGHGAAYNGDATNLGYSVYIAGIELISRQITIANGATASLGENVLGRTFTATDITTGGSGAVTDVVTVIGEASKAMANGSLALTLTYENTSGSYAGYSTITNTGGSPRDILITYERTTQQRVVKLYIVNYGETDPKNNYLESYLVSFKSAGTDEAGHAIWVEDVVNAASEICSIAVNASYDQTTRILGTKPDLSDIKQFASGTDGTYAANDADISTAYQVFLKKAYDITLLTDAGYSGTVKATIANVARQRLFPFAFIDPPASYFITGTNTPTWNQNPTTVAQKLVKWRMNGDTLEPLPIASIDGEFAGLAGSTWGQITDAFNAGRKLIMPPSYETVQNAITVIDTLGPWNSVMGPRRGVTGFERLVVNCYEDRNTLNVKQVNPLIIDERGVQMFYGNKTLKTTASAMQQMHARITRSLMSREFYFAALDFIAEGIVDATYNDLRDEFEAIIAKYAPALESYSLVVGPPKTTTADINNQILRIGVGLIFNQIAEEISITTTVFKNGDQLSVEII